MALLICCALFLPLISFLILMVSSGMINRKTAQVVACASVFLSFICFTVMLVLGSPAETMRLFTWIPIEQVKTDFALHVDSLAVLMGLIITGVGFLIHVYSIGYIEHEEDFARYFACMNFFIFSMLLLVLAANLLVMFVGWEGVGLASYLLIGYWFHRPAAAQAATKAFVMNRIGDLGFLLGLLLTFYLFGTSDIEAISAATTQNSALANSTVITVMTLLLFAGAVGKSAQIPLQTWLPDAMEGPTPVSALIHAATMVTAGVYLVVRLHDLFSLAPITMWIIALVGALTSLYAAFCAVGQTDIKRVLAYSTVSQLGLMFMACGIGAFFAAMFHLTAHAFVKALLFLAAGNLIHMLHGLTDMGKLGGLYQRMPATGWLFMVGVVAMVGIPPLSAFFSKDLILEQAHSAGYTGLFYIGIITSILTAFYLMRAFVLTFLGPLRLDSKYIKMLEEAPPIMLIPLLVLAVLAITGGILDLPFSGQSWLQSYLGRSDVMLATEPPANIFLVPETWVAVIGTLLGIWAASYVYKQAPDKFREPIESLKRGMYFNDFYWNGIAVPLKQLAKIVADKTEPVLFEGSVDATARATNFGAAQLQKWQNGQIRSYIAWMVLGTIFLIVYLVF